MDTKRFVVKDQSTVLGPKFVVVDTHRPDLEPFGCYTFRDDAERLADRHEIAAQNCVFPGP